jgi:MYXO-CTERM domain-containing protein
MAMGCACIAGFEPDMAGTACVPSTQGCGEETPAGRCLEQLLVYCDDVTDPNTPQSAVIDCAASGLSCATDMDGFVGCIAATDPCGDIPEAGRCNGDGLQFCAGEGAERGAYELNCAELNAHCEAVNGGADCVENGNPMNPDGGVGADGGGDGGAGAKKSGCGCEAAGGEGSSTAGGGIAVLGLGLLLWRRSRPRG